MMIMVIMIHSRCAAVPGIHFHQDRLNKRTWSYISLAAVWATVPPASAFLAASSAFFFSRAFRFSSWIRNCSLSWNERKGYKAKYKVFVIVHFSLQIYETAKPVFIHLLSFVQLITKSLEQRQ